MPAGSERVIFIVDYCCEVAVSAFQLLLIIIVMVLWVHTLYALTPSSTARSKSSRVLSVLARSTTVDTYSHGMCLKPCTDYAPRH